METISFDDEAKSVRIDGRQFWFNHIPQVYNALKQLSEAGDAAKLRGDQMHEANRVLSQRLEERDQWFVRKVLEYSEGCDSGKRDFIEYCDLTMPMTTTEFIVTVTHDTLTDRDDIENDLNDCIRSSRDEDLIRNWDVSW